VKERTLEAYENQEYQFEDLVDSLSIPRDTSRNPIIDVTFNYVERTTIDLMAQESNQEESKLETNPNSRFDLTLSVIEYKEDLLIQFKYCRKLFEKESIQRFSQYFNQILEGVLTQPGQKILEIDILNQDEKFKILNEFNEIPGERPTEKPLHYLFEERVEKSENLIATATEDQWISYRELNHHANVLAHQLMSYQVQPEEMVPILLNRTFEMIASIMAVIKTGAAYVPLDPKFKNQRIQFILADTLGEVVITEESLTPLLPREQVHLLREKRGQASNPNPDFRVNPGIEVTADHAIYSIYTSGSTGKPKGVLVTHGNLVNYLQAIAHRFSLNESLRYRYALTSTFATDLGNTMVFPPLLTGGSVLVIPERILLDIDRLAYYFERSRIQGMKIVPSHFIALLNTMGEKAIPEEILILGGESLGISLVRSIRKIKPDLRIYNHYGPTETTIGVTTWDCRQIEEYETSVPIGRALKNSGIHILDKRLQLVPIGVTGELYVFGHNVARGYLNNPGLTHDTFVNKGGQATMLGRMYRTGDLARRLPNGDIRFLGRADGQVKIRGYRIELGEIETQIIKTEGIKEAVVIQKESYPGDKYLCAYLVKNKSDSLFKTEAIDVSELKTTLSEMLPDYMVPSYFVEIDSIPLAPNGKINRRALPEPEIKTKGNMAPSNETELKLQELWSEVLGIETSKIGIDADFFELGGHSLKAIILISKIHREFQVKVPLIELFKHSTIGELSSILGQKPKEAYIPIPFATEKEYYKLSSAQRRLYLLQQMEPQTIAYNMPQQFPIHREISVQNLKKAFHQLIHRHESLRTSFHMVGGTPFQKVHPAKGFKITEYKGGKPENEELFTDFISSFDLSSASLIRVGVLDTGKGDKQFFLDMHHIISDGVSQKILRTEFLALLEGETLSPCKPLQYKDYAEWQHSDTYKKSIMEQESFWQQEFQSELITLDLPMDVPRPSVQSFQGSTMSFFIGEQETAQIRQLTKKQDITLFMALMGAYFVLLHKLSGLTDIVIGTPVAGRDHPDIEEMVGVFINTLAIRSNPSGDKEFQLFLEEIKKKSLGAFENQRYPFEDLVEMVSIDRNISRNPIFDVMFILHNQLDIQEDLLSMGDDEIRHGRQGISKFDLSLRIRETEKRMYCNLEYCTALFQLESIEEIIGYFRRIICQVAQKPDIKISDINILSKEERERILIAFNQTEVAYSKEKLLHQLFQEKVKKTPENISLIYEDHQLSFQELGLRSHHMGKRLREKGLTRDSLAVLLVGRSPNIAIGLWSILKAGGAYLPLDSEYPENRIKTIINESGAKIVLTDLNVDLDVEGDYHVLHFENKKASPKKTRELDNLNDSNDLAYVIYTSGSTGKPKGVMIQHQSLTNFIKGITRSIPFSTEDNILSLTTITFDIFGLEVILPLTCGSKVILGNREQQLNPMAISKLIINQKITIFQVTPSRLQMILLDKDSAQSLGKLDYLLIGGESLPQSLLEITWEYAVNKIYNLYGPTETTIWSTMKDVSRGESLNIGKPIVNTSIYILDKFMKPQPIGVTGELYIGGEGLARGYFRDEVQTRARFQENPFKTGEIIYKTGDLAKWLADGNIQHCGREDFQVKIRGFRIELGEIENQLLAIAGIEEAVVMDRKDETGDKYLCAYIVKNESNEYLQFRKNQFEMLYKELSNLLPVYMIPAHIMEIERIPLSPSGKIARKLLPEPDYFNQEQYIPPCNDVENQLAGMWSEILMVNKDLISVDANFFKLGGNSLKAMALLTKINDTMGITFTLLNFFKYPSIKESGAIIELVRGTGENEDIEERETEEIIL
jgi:tyrocidine synthetase-3